MVAEFNSSSVFFEKNSREDGLVSIIMPVHNARDFIEETIESIIAQTYEKWELIIVDDCSSDGTVEFLKSKYSFLGTKIRLFELAINSGPAVARNRAILESKGRFIAFLDCDDLWLPHKLECQLSFMREKSVPFTFTSFYKVDENGKVIGIVDIPENCQEVSYQDLLKSNVIQCSTVIYDAYHLGTVLMPLIRRRQDFGLWLKLLKLTPVCILLNEKLTSYRVRGGSLSSNKWISIQYTWKIYREVEKLSFVKALWYFGNYLVRTIAKYQRAKL